jgi:hypothetical protein
MAQDLPAAVGRCEQPTHHSVEVRRLANDPLETIRYN